MCEKPVWSQEQIEFVRSQSTITNISIYAPNPGDSLYDVDFRWSERDSFHTQGTTVEEAIVRILDGTWNMLQNEIEQAKTHLTAFESYMEARQPWTYSDHG
jgi:hypothetical protein